MQIPKKEGFPVGEGSQSDLFKKNVQRTPESLRTLIEYVYGPSGPVEVNEGFPGSLLIEMCALLTL